MSYDIVISMLAATLRLTTPLLLGCLAGLYSERSGIFDIGLEGKMLVGAFAAAAVSYLTANMWLGLLAAMAASVLMAMIHGLASIAFRGNQIISGVAINFLADGLTVVVAIAFFSLGGDTPPMPPGGRFPPIIWPYADQIRAVPIVGPIYGDLLSGQNILVYIAFLAVPITWWVLYRTRFGLRLRAVGENPKAVDTAGISVPRLRYQALLITGILCGIAGAYFSTAQGSGFHKEMTAGAGYIALAALIFAKWRPVPAMFATLLFGFLDALQIRLQGVPLPIINWAIPVQFIQALPYILTCVLLAGFIGKAIGPKAGGVPYTKER
ncbi:MAG TPA: ABC transporter permease [Stellaceae bacterium]|nr:ABC transporter permease [Stellaceae bacterium]